MTHTARDAILFTHEGRAYQAVARPSDTEWVIQVLEQGVPVPGIRLTVSFETQSDAAAQGFANVPRDLVHHLQELARDYIVKDGHLTL